MKIKKMRADTFCRFVVGVLYLGSALAAQATTWTYSSDAKTIADGQWTLKVSSLDKTEGTIGITGISSWSDPSDSTKGIIDLRSPLYVKDGDDDSTEVKSVRIGKNALAFNEKITEIYCDIISALLAEADGSNFAGNKNMTKIEIGGTADSVSGLILNNNTSLKTIKLDFPNMRSIGNKNSQTLLGNNTSPNAIDVSTIATPGVTNVYGYALAHGCYKGDIVFTNIMAMGTGAFQGASLTNVYLAGSLTTLPQYVLRGTTITNVVLDLPNLTTINYEAFGHATAAPQAKIRRVELVSALPDMGQVTNIVRFANNSNIGDLRIYVSRKQWTPSEAETYDATSNLTGFFSRITAQEKAALDEETQKKVIGVLVKGGTRKGIFVHKASIHDPLGMFIRIR